MPLGQLLFGFDGRIRRTTFWLASLGAGAVLGVGLVVVMSVIGLGAGMLASGSGGGGFPTGAGGLLLIPVLLAWMVLTMWIGLALNIKRWHDRDKPWSWIFISLIPIIGAIWALVEVGFLDGTPGPNRYGPSPKGLGGAAPMPGAQPQILQ